MAEAVKPLKTGEHEEVRGTANKIGGVIETPQGNVKMLDAPGFTTLLVEQQDPADSRVAILVYDPEIATGMVTQLDADGARTVAASLLCLANLLEPRRDN